MNPSSHSHSMWKIANWNLKSINGKGYELTNEMKSDVMYACEIKNRMVLISTSMEVTF